MDFDKLLVNCILCPRNCNVDRFSGKLGYCNSDAGFNISAICLHKGEEPVLGGHNGICNVFFSKCNLQCIYCQNFQISNKFSPEVEYTIDLDRIVDLIINILETNKIRTVGFVSPTHQIPQVIAICQAVKCKFVNPIFIYNSNGYEKVESLKLLENYIDIYLPDFKYADNSLATKLSDVNNYFEVARKSIKEMYRQKGSVLFLDDNGLAECGLIIRHLVLPGFVENSLEVIRTIATDISPNVHISLMSQYFPTKNVIETNTLSRRLYSEEYQIIINELEHQGLSRGWIQELESSSFYLPDFKLSHPFEYNH